jgi:hypothetical protein
VTVSPLRAPRRRTSAAPHALELACEAAGTFRSPTGRTGRFSGTYRLERLSPGPLATGVVTGRLVDADGTWVGLAARRTRAPAQVDADGDVVLLRVGPFAVDLLGLAVQLEPLVVDLHRPVGTAR